MDMIATLLTLLSLTTAVMAQDNPTDTPVTSVPFLDLPRYMGRWFGIARLPNSFQSSTVGSVVIADYTLNENGTVAVHNSGFNPDGTNTSARGLARRPDPENYPARLELTFVPANLRTNSTVWGNYWVVMLDNEHYQWSVVGGPSRANFHILSRERTLDNTIFEQIIDNATSMGYNLTNLIVY